MPSPARVVAFELLRRIEQQHARSDDALNSRQVSRLSPRDRNLVTEIVYGSLRWLSLLDHVLAQISSRPWASVDLEAKVLLRMGLYQIWHLDRMPNHAVVHDAVEITKRVLSRGAEGFVNGILRRLARERPWEKERLEVDYPPWIKVSLPDWLWKRWSERFGAEQAREYALSLNETPLETLRAADAGLPMEKFEREMQRSELVPGAMLRHRVAGHSDRANLTDLNIQDEASQLVPHLFGNIEGMRVLDACAAPGGKSAILRGLVGHDGLVVSSDRSCARIRRLARLLISPGVAHLRLVVADASHTLPFRVPFDAVLADVPCSGLGTLRRNPEIKWRFQPDRFAALQATQLEILSSASAVVRPGGLLLYSTCSTEPEENELVVGAFLDAHPEFCLRTPVHPPGIGSWTSPDGFVRTFPGTRLWDGFFAALLARAF